MKPHVFLLSVALILLVVAAITLALGNEPALAHRCFMGGLTTATLYFCARPHSPGRYAPPARVATTRSLVVDRATQERKSA